VSRIPHSGPRPTSARRLWLLAFAAFALLAVAWSVGMPEDGTTDERQHLERAYGVVTGHLVAPQAQDPMLHRPGAAFEVPKSLLPPNALCVYFPNFHLDQSWVARSASCQEKPPATHAKKRVVSWVGRYNPWFYLGIGAPLRFWPSMTGIVLSRILAALLASAFAAAAAVVAIRTRRPLLLAAQLTVLTPATIALSSTVNPNGIEITAALLLWVCAVDLARPRAAGLPGPAGSAGAAAPAAAATSAGSSGSASSAASAASASSTGSSGPAGASAPAGPSAISQRALLAMAAVAGAVVLTVRAAGPFWFLLAVGGALAVAEPGRIRELLRWRPARLVAAVWAVVGVQALVWNKVSGNDKVTHTVLALHPVDHRLVTLLRVIAVDRVGGWFTEAFALDVQAPWVPLLWAAAAAALLVPLAMVRSRRVVAVALAVAGASLGLTVVLEVKYLGTLGWSQFGRYFLPGLAGTAVLLGSGRRVALPPVLCRRLPRLFAVCAALCQLWVLAVEMTRVQGGPDAPLNPFAGSWHPAVGSVTVLVLAGLGAAALIVLVWTATAVGTGAPGDAAADAGTDSAPRLPGRVLVPEPQVVTGAANP
jgi:hypothetical protein